MATEMNKKYGDWINERNLGAGGFGIVQFWKNCRTGEKIAIKVCKDASSLSDKQKQRWNNEVKIMNILKHPNLIASVKLPEQLKFIQSVVPVLCMEYCGKGDLRKFLAHPKNCFGLEQLKAFKLMSDVSAGVEFLHKKNITHRDLKPENVVIKETNGKVTYKLIDLGYAKELGEDSLYASLVGTLNYVAPELFRNGKYSCSVDYWSLGILFYEIITGSRPFLPHMKSTVAWMNAVLNKSYDKICAHEIEGKIHLYSDIADPADLSESFREKLVEWFRVALQWDPRQRGKLPNSSPKTEVILFDLLKDILSKKELHVFIVSQYKIITFPVNEKSTLANLQQWIQEKAGIPILQQTITAFECRILNNSETLLSQVNVTSEIPHVLVFQTGKLHLEKLPDQNLPKPIERVLEKPSDEFDYCERIQFIKAVMFFINQEIKFSKMYQLALSIKIDLLDQRFAELDEKLKSGTKSLSLLKLEVEETVKTENDLVEKHVKRFKDIITKIEEKPLKTIIQMRKRTEMLKQVSDELRKFSEINLITDFSNLFDRVAENFALEDHTLLKATVTTTTKLFFRFLELRSSNIERNNDILETTQRISYLENEISKLENFLNSANVLNTSYKSEFHQLKENVKSKRLWEIRSEPESGQFSPAGTSHSSLNSNFFDVLSNEGESLICDSLILRNMMSNLVTKLNEDIPTLLNLDS